MKNLKIFTFIFMILVTCFVHAQTLLVPVNDNLVTTVSMPLTFNKGTAIFADDLPFKMETGISASIFAYTGLPDLGYDPCWLFCGDSTYDCYDSTRVGVKKIGGPVILDITSPPLCYGQTYGVFLAPYGTGNYRVSVAIYSSILGDWHGTTVYHFIAPLACGKLSDIDQQTNMSIYPNPTNGNVIIDIPIDGFVEIENLNGEKIGSYLVHTGENNFNLDYPSGMYIVRFRSEDGSITLDKIVVQ